MELIIICIIGWIDASQDNTMDSYPIEHDLPTPLTISSGYLVKEDSDKVIIARECFLENNRVNQVRGRIAIPRIMIKFMVKFKMEVKDG